MLTPTDVRVQRHLHNTGLLWRYVPSSECAFGAPGPAFPNYEAIMAKDTQQQTGAGEPSDSFEAWLEELESVVEKMEQGDLSLENSLTLFERGMSLSERCQKALEHAEQKVRVLSKQSADAELEPFDDA